MMRPELVATCASLHNHFARFGPTADLAVASGLHGHLTNRSVGSIATGLVAVFVTGETGPQRSLHALDASKTLKQLQRSVWVPTRRREDAVPTFVKLPDEEGDKGCRAFKN